VFSWKQRQMKNRQQILERLHVYLNLRTSNLIFWMKLWLDS
jgi:hypothetical protein